MLLVNFSICMRVACCYLFVFVWWLFCANLLLCLGSKLPHKKRTTTTPPVWKNKKIYKAWLSLVKFVSEKYFQKERPELGQTIHTGMIQPGAEHSAGHPPPHSTMSDILNFLQR